MGNKTMLRKMFLLCAFLIPSVSSANEAPASLSLAIANTFSELILPNLPGATLLLVISVLISTLTFFADLKRTNLSGKGSSRYLILWIFGNYSFALVLLVLILPEGTRLDQLDRTLLLYCLIASGLPEMSAYLKIQLGNSNKGVNLYKIREIFTDYIARRVNLISENAEWQNLQLFKYIFVKEPSLLNEKLIAFANVCNFPDVEKNEILACLPSANNNDIDACINNLTALDDAIKDKLFSFFKNDIRRYQSSSSAKLVRNLYPPLSATEAQNLVVQGVISPFRFLLRTLARSQRQKLASLTHIEDSKLALLHNELRGSYRAKFRRFVLGTFLLFLFIVISSIILGMQMEKVQNQEYQNIVPGEEFSLPSLLPE